ncbi:molybdopterin-dependent oxidoreductase [Marinovum sp.]|uniref:molybdopterin-dependent oxidoreductase n=1 Tax=Marinovum sp. TaxID=2024839 RepID=UPI002B267F9B|nr:molybdopterin-dependent oxidoreductase [Marinovum sp.]
MTQAHKSRARRALATLAVLAVSATGAVARMLEAPEGEVILTVSGNVQATNATGKAEFDLAMLEALPVTEFTTSTIWTEGTHTYTGVALETFLDAVAAEGTRLEAMAINDYSVEIPISDAIEGGPILAYKVDGAPMSRREKGPIWLIYPYDQSVDYRSETIYTRSIWQLDRLHVE